MNDEADNNLNEEAAPVAEKLVSLPLNNNPLTLTSQSTAPEAERQGRVESVSSSVETTVCVRGKCELVSKQ